VKELIDFGKLAESAKALANHAIDFDPPIIHRLERVRLQKCYTRATGVANFCQNESTVSYDDKLLIAALSFRVARSAHRPAAGPWRFNQQRVPPTPRDIFIFALNWQCHGDSSAYMFQLNYLLLSSFLTVAAPGWARLS
jgi:hypothetical protein